MRLLSCLILLALLPACAPMPALAQAQPVTAPPSGDMGALVNAAQATMQAAALSATQQAGATQQAREGTAQAWQESQSKETQRVQRATQQSGSDAATSTANVRSTWDAATSTAGAMQLQATALQATAGALEQERRAFEATQAAALDRGSYHVRLTAIADAAANETRTDRLMTNVKVLAWVCLIVVPAFVLGGGFWSIVRFSHHKMVMSELQLQLAAGLTPMLSAPATPIPNAPQMNSYRQAQPRPSNLKEHALAWVDRSIEQYTEDGTQLSGWQGATSDSVRTALQAAGLVIVEAGVGTFVRKDGRGNQLNLEDLRGDIERLGDDLR